MLLIRIAVVESLPIPHYGFVWVIIILDINKVLQLVDFRATGYEWSGKAHPTHPPTREKREEHANLSPGILGTLAFWYKSADIPTYDSFTKVGKHTCNTIEVEKQKFRKMTA